MFLEVLITELGQQERGHEGGMDGACDEAPGKHRAWGCRKVEGADSGLSFSPDLSWE